jgi:HK97 family phage portal protein
VTLLRRIESRTVERRGADPYAPWGTSQIPTSGMMGYTTAGVPMNDDAALSIATVWGCVAILADAISTLPLTAFDLASTKSTRSKVAIDPQPALITNPWPEGTLQDFLTQVMVSLTVRGNFYGWILDRDGNGTPSLVKPIHPDMVTVTRARSDDPTVRGQVVYRIQGQVVPTAQILHLRALMLPGAVVGMNPIEYLRTSFSISSAAEKYGGQFFANSAVPTGVIEVEGDLSPKETLEMRRAWSQHHGGVANAGMPAVLVGGSTYKQIQLNPDDAQFLATRAFQKSEISGTIFRIPAHMIGDQDRTPGIMGPEQYEISFVQNTLLGWIKRIEIPFTNLLPPTQYAKFNLDERLRGDTLQRAQAWTLGLNGGWLCPDDVCEKEDKPPLPNGAGQIFVRPMNFANAERFKQIEPPDPAGHAPDSVGPAGGPGGGVATTPAGPPYPHQGGFGAPGKDG